MSFRKSRTVLIQYHAGHAEIIVEVNGTGCVLGHFGKRLLNKTLHDCPRNNKSTHQKRYIFDMDISKYCDPSDSTLASDRKLVHPIQLSQWNNGVQIGHASLRRSIPLKEWSCVACYNRHCNAWLRRITILKEWSSMIICNKSSERTVMCRITPDEIVVI